jgi:sulfate adenylyltransferase/3'-phosphoadenosine 5'-phosphosulfate synthase
MVAAELRRRGVHVETLDGDEVRTRLSRGLGFSREDRDENIRRIGFVARLVARSGGCAIAAAISPYRDVRNEVRRSVDRFVEVYTECPLSVLEERDPKGLYKKALAGEIRNFTGVDDPYEAPDAPEVHLRTNSESPTESLAKLLRWLEERDLVPVSADAVVGDAVAQGLVAPHGHELVDRTLDPRIWEDELVRAEGLPTLDLTANELRDLLMIAAGAYSPLRGFMTSKDYLRVVHEMRLESGLPWSLPVTLALPKERRNDLRGDQVALREPGGAIVATMLVRDAWEPDLAAEAKALGAGSHAGATSVERAASVVYVGGELRGVDPQHSAGLRWFRRPSDTRAEMSQLGWRRVVAVHTPSPALGSDEYLSRAALEFADGLLIQPTATPRDEVPVEIRSRCFEALTRAYFGFNTAMVAPYISPPPAGANRALVHDAIVAKNYGASHLLALGRPSEGHPFTSHGSAELGIEILPWSPAGISDRLGMLTTKSAPHSLNPLSPDTVLEALRKRLDVDPRILRPEVALILRRHLQLFE